MELFHYSLTEKHSHDSISSFNKVRYFTVASIGCSSTSLSFSVARLACLLWYTSEKSPGENGHSKQEECEESRNQHIEY